MKARHACVISALASVMSANVVSAQPVPEITPYKPVRPGDARINMVMPSDLVSAPVEVAVQLGAGWLTTMMFSGLFYFGARIKAGCAGAEYRCEYAAPVYVPAIVHHVAINSATVWSIGRLNGSRGRYLATLWGSAIGAAVGLGVHFARGRDACIILTREACSRGNDPASLGDGLLLSVWPSLGAVFGYRLSARARSRASMPQEPLHGSWSLGVTRHGQGARLLLTHQF